jgi:hypothetical protein
VPLGATGGGHWTGVPDGGGRVETAGPATEVGNCACCCSAFAWVVFVSSRAKALRLGRDGRLYATPAHERARGEYKSKDARRRVWLSLTGRYVAYEVPG